MYLVFIDTSTILHTCHLCTDIQAFKPLGRELYNKRVRLELGQEGVVYMGSHVCMNVYIHAAQTCHTCNIVV